VVSPGSTFCEVAPHDGTPAAGVQEVAAELAARVAVLPASAMRRCWPKVGKASGVRTSLRRAKAHRTSARELCDTTPPPDGQRPMRAPTRLPP
jgi:hypothetical protein